MNHAAAHRPHETVAAVQGAAGNAPGLWNDRLQLMLESTGDGIFGVDNAGLCIFVNRAACEMLGWRAEQVLGSNMHGLIHLSRGDGSHYPESDCPIFNAFREGLPCRIESEVLWRADGSQFHVSYSSHPIVDGGTVRGAVVTFVDITERKRADDLLHQARADLERRVEERTVELSSALAAMRELSAHLETVREEERTRIARDIHDELGSLLVSLKLDVDWLRTRQGGRTDLAAKCQGMGARIDSAVDTLGRIITDLRPSILDHQGLWAALEWQAQEFVERTGLAADVKVHVAAGVEAPGGVAGERWSIAVFRIFQEMLSNVARHAQAERIVIRLYVDGPPEAALYLDVRDDGIGAVLERLADARSYGVMGMRERAGHFGGTVTIASRPGRGTQVSLAMPFPACVDGTAGRWAAPEPGRAPSSGSERSAGGGAFP